MGHALGVQPVGQPGNLGRFDLGLSKDPQESYKLFQSRILEEYEKMIAEFGLRVIDATLPLLAQHDHVREVVQPHLSNALLAERRGWREVLATEALEGRYLDEIVAPGGQP